MIVSFKHVLRSGYLLYYSKEASISEALGLTPLKIRALGHTPLKIRALGHTPLKIRALGLTPLKIRALASYQWNSLMGSSSEHNSLILIVNVLKKDG